MKLWAGLLFILSTSIGLGQEVTTISADHYPSTLKGHVEDLEHGQLLYRDGRLLKDFSRMGKINPKFFKQDGRVVVDICDYHFPPGSVARKEIEAALTEYSQLEGVDIHWKIKAVPHRNADDLISSKINYGSLRIDFADADKYPNACKRKGEKGTWVLTRCGFSKWGGWHGADLFGNLDAGAILINRYKYCAKDEKKCLTNFPTKQAYLHELGHFFGMTHSSSWPKQQRSFTSVMGAHQDYLTVFDAKNLRSNYGKDELTETLESDRDDFVVMGRMKWTDDALNFSDANPEDLYFVSADLPLYDCKTNQPAKFQVGLYNRAASDIGEQFEVDVAIGVSIGSQKYEMAKLALTHIPPYSEIVWKGQMQSSSRVISISKKTKARYFLRLTPSKIGENSLMSGGIKENKSKHLQLIDINLHPSVESCAPKVNKKEESQAVVEECFED